jgi:hypothetical protein
MDEQYFLVTGRLTIKQYEGGSETTDVMRLVLALDSDDAEQKFEEHFESKTQEYAVYYRVSGIEVLPTIV